MPNYTRTTLQFKSKEDLLKVWNGMQVAKNGESRFSFEGVIPSPKEESPWFDWLEWNLEKHGCKWDADNALCNEEECKIEFDTPYNKPNSAVFKKIAGSFGVDYEFYVFNEESGYEQKIYEVFSSNSKPMVKGKNETTSFDGKTRIVTCAFRDLAKLIKRTKTNTCFWVSGKGSHIGLKRVAIALKKLEREILVDLDLRYVTGITKVFESKLLDIPSNTYYQGWAKRASLDLGSRYMAGKMDVFGSHPTPETLDKFGMEIYDYSGFSFCNSLSGIKLPYSVSKIGHDAFFGCKNLANVEIPDGVKEIGAFAFACTSITAVELPSNIREIQRGTFGDCNYLTSIKIPHGIEKIAPIAFKDCKALESMEIPDSVRKIGHSAFEGCKSFKAITIPGSVTKIAGGVFTNCENLTSIDCPLLEMRGRLLLSDNGKTVNSCMGGDGAIAIPNGVTRIGEFAFWECDCHENIKIPGSVTEIGEFAFWRCTSGEYTEVPECKGIAIHSYENIEIPGSVTEIGEYAFCGCNSIESVKLPDTITKIYTNTFCSCESLEKVKIPDSVTRIYWGAFADCCLLKKVSVPANCEIAYDAFDEDVEIIWRQESKTAKKT